MWRTGNAPVAHEGGDGGLAEFVPSEWDPDGVAATIEACRIPPLYRRFAPRAPHLDLPFRARDYRGAWLPPPGSE